MSFIYRGYLVGWFSNKVDGWALGKQEQELSSFVAVLKAMDNVELGYLIAMATHMRHGLEEKGHNVMDPILYAAQNPKIAILLSGIIAEFQKQGRPHDAAALMVWAHTRRGGIRVELRGIVRSMWEELERGFPYVESSASSMRDPNGLPVNIAGANLFPIGFTPKPI